MKVSVYTFGCKANRAESEELGERFRRSGFSIVPCGEKTDVYVVNACSVTQKAEKEVRQTIHKIKHLYPQARIFVAGCFTQDLINKESEKVDRWIKDFKISSVLPAKTRRVDGRAQKRFSSQQSPAGSGEKRTRALIKIQGGCRRYCAFCIVPFLKTRLKSRSIKKVIQEIKDKEKQGYQEVVLVGTNIGEYNRKVNPPAGGQRLKVKIIRLIDLLKEILKKTSTPRIRLSSLWPTVVTPELIRLIKKEPRICPHLHLSVQSASDKILKAMGRDYTNQDLRRIVKNLRQIPNLNLTADIIVGFPGETESDFKQTADFVKEAKFIKVHIFRFSPRAGTRAYSADNQISEIIKKNRSKKLAELSAKVNQNKIKKYIKQTFPVLFEHQQAGYRQGFTPNYLKVFVKNKKDLTNQIVKVKLSRLYKEGFIGKLINIHNSY